MRRRIREPCTPPRHCVAGTHTTRMWTPDGTTWAQRYCRLCGWPMSARDVMRPVIRLITGETALVGQED
jgi:hypothetical protein